jgi:hypothetical protein
MRRFLTAALTGGTCLILLLATAWAAMALWHHLPLVLSRGWLPAAGFTALGLGAAYAQFTPRRLRALATFALALATVLFWWSALAPPQDRNWSPDVARQVTGTLDGDILTLDGVRNFRWETPEDFIPAWETRVYDLAALRTVDLAMSYWAGPEMAHMILSFGFADGEHLAWSVEVRREEGGGFSPIADLFKANTLAIIAADERDLIGTRTNARGEDVRLFRTNTPPERARALLMQYVEASNRLAASPQWYNSLTTNCTTVVMQMIRTIVDEVPLDWRVLANGYLPDYAYEQGVFGTRYSIEELRRLGAITERARAHGLKPGYSQAMRDDVPSPLE